MRRLSAFLAILISLSLIAGSAAHAVEPIFCVDGEVAVAFGHFDGDSDEVPADEGKAAPHHHGGCHGHHISELARDSSAGFVSMGKFLPGFGVTADGPSTLIDPAYRPPRA